MSTVFHPCVARARTLVKFKPRTIINTGVLFIFLSGNMGVPIT
jgi:hypothetical protein